MRILLYIALGLIAAYALFYLFAVAWSHWVFRDEEGERWIS